MNQPKTDRALQVLLALLFIGFIFIIKDSFVERIVSVGDRAPDFSIRADDGRMMSRSDFGGKVLILNFWATWCPPCVEEIPSLDALQRQLRDAGLVVLAVSVDKNENVYRRFLSQAKVAFTTARDENADISSNYGTFRWPETYVIDRSGTVIQKHISNQNWMDPKIANQIKALL